MLAALTSPKSIELQEPVSWIPVTVMGTLLVLFGIGLLIWQMRIRNLQTFDSTRTPDVVTFQQRQFRRRAQVSGLLVLIGLLLPLGDWGIDWKQQGYVAWTIYWMSVLMVTLWVLLLAVGDLLSTRTHARISMSRLRQTQQALEQEAERLRAEARRESRPRG